MTHLEDAATLSPDTVVVTMGRPERTADRPLNEPITMASTYVAGGEVEYGRYGNPTWSAFEETLGALEGGQCLAFSSGLSAVSTILDLVGHRDVVVAPRHSYSGTIMQLADREVRGRITARLVDITDSAAVAEALEDAALLWLESPTNPALEVVELEEVIRAAHGAGAQVVVDNTFATPLRQRPLAVGADLVVHSATKLLSGHGDVVMGAVVVSSPQLYDELKKRRDLEGSIPGTFEAWLALRGVRTLAVRLDRAEATARLLAQRLSAHPEVADVRYPGFGTIVSFTAARGPLAADLLTRSTRLWVHATSLGGVESSLERRRRWQAEAQTIPEALVRLSVGIEDAEDLWRDLDQALDVMRSAAADE